MSRSLESITDTNFEVVREYLHTGMSGALTSEQQDMLDKCIEAYGLLKRYPQRNVCIRQFMVTTKCAYNTAAKYIDFARRNWYNYLDLKPEFLKAFFLNHIMSEISSPDASEAIRSKNLATLQKYIENMPDDQIDPKLMEANNIFIQVNVDGRKINLSEKLLDSLPQNVRCELLNALQGDISDAEAVEQLES